MTADPLRLLFVCTANISRSPYAERRARALLGQSPITVASAGVPGLPCRTMDPQMVAQLKQRGDNGEGHLSRCLNEDILAESDLVLTFELAQEIRVREGWPEYAARTFGLGQFVDALTRFAPAGLPAHQLVLTARAQARPNSMGWDFDDPHGRGRRAAKLAARDIDRAVDELVRRLLGLRPG